MHNSSIFLFFSAVAYTMPFLAPTYGWWLIFLFPPLLFGALKTERLNRMDCFIWAAAVSTIHIAPIGDAIIQMTRAPLILQLLPTILLMLYVSCYPLCLLLVLKKTAANILFATVALWIYLLMIEYLIFFPFGRIEGFVFMNPLLPVTTFPALLAPLHWIPMPALLLLYCVTTGAVTHLLMHCSRKSAVLLTACIAIWIIPSIYRKPKSTPPWTQQIGRLTLMLPETISAERGSLLIAHEVTMLAQSYPRLKLVVLPESSWNGLALNETFFLEAMHNLPIPHILIGSFSYESGCHTNSLYWFENGQRMGRFDKRHALPLVERIPWGAERLCTRLFFTKTDPTECAQHTQQLMHLDQNVTLAPYICSELFCNTCPYDPESNAPILASCNDWWFGSIPFRNLMLRVAQLRAIQWNRRVLYLSFYHAHYIDQNGITHQIGTTQSDHFLK